MRLCLFVVCIMATASAQVNIYNPNCKTDGSDQTACFQGAFPSHSTVAVGPGTYTIAGTLYLGTNDTLVGAGPAQTTLNFTCTTAPCNTQGKSVAIVFESPNEGGLGGLQHLTVSGPFIANPPWASYPSQPVGIFMGQDTHGLLTPPPPSVSKSTATTWYGDDLKFDDIVVTGFITGLQVGANAYLDSFKSSRFVYDITGVFAPANTGNSGEKMVFSDCQFEGLVTAINDQSGLEWMIDNGTFDTNSGPYIVLTGGNVDSNQLRIVHSHFETNTVAFTGGFITNQSGGLTGTPIINIQDTTFLMDNPPGTSTSKSPLPPAMINTSGSVTQLNIIGGWADSTEPIAFVNSAKSVLMLSVAGNNPSGPWGKINSVILAPPSTSMVLNVFGGPF